MSKSYTIQTTGRAAESESKESKFSVKVLTDDLEFRGELLSPPTAPYLDILGRYTTYAHKRGRVLAKTDWAVLRIPKSRVLQFRTLQAVCVPGSRPCRGFPYSTSGVTL